MRGGDFVKYTKTILSLLLAVLLCAGLLAMPAQAAEVNQDGLQVTLTTDQASYTDDQTVTASLTVTNTNDFALENVDLSLLIPEGFEAAGGTENSLKVSQLAAGQTVTLTVTLKSRAAASDSSDDADDTSAPTEGTTAPTEGTTAPTEATTAPTEGTTAPTEATTAPTQASATPTQPQKDSTNANTGDRVLLWAALMAVSAVGMVVLFVLKRKQAVRVMCLVLCLVLLAGASPAVHVKAAEPRRVELTASIQMEGTAVSLQAVVTYEIPEATDAPETTPEADPNSDEDQDGITLFYEEFLGTDPRKADTDGDGLTDDKEVLIGTSPLLADTDGDGTYDGDEDADGDSLTNLQEIALGTSPVDDDTDGDGLTDYEEANLQSIQTESSENSQNGTAEGDLVVEDVTETQPAYNSQTGPGTEALNADTDGDGALDGWEVDHGYDPLTPEEVFAVEDSTVTDSAQAQVSAQVAAEQITTVSLEEIPSNVLLDESIPGYMAAPVKFSVEGSVQNGEIAITFDETLLESGTVNPTIYRFNKETQQLQEVSTTVTGNVAYAAVSGTDIYILLDKNQFDKTWTTEILAPVPMDQTIDVVFAIDASNSMNYYKRMKVAKAALNTFIDALDEGDRAALVSYNSTATNVSPLTADKSAVKAAVAALICSGDTATYTGFESAVGLLSNEQETYGYKMIILLSDGTEPLSHYEAHYNALVEQAVAAGITVHTIGTGNTVDAALMTRIAQATGGHYYNATLSDEIGDAFDDITDQTVDSNNDGITDYHTKLLCEGELMLGTGVDNPFAGLSFRDIQQDTDGDYDNDGLLSGAELEILADESDGHLYVKMNSDPTLVDTDYDGIDDPEEKSGFALENEFYADAYHSVSGKDTSFGAIFTVDYRRFFEDNTQYNRDLAVLASLYAHDMYIDNYLEMTYGADGVTEDINGVKLGEIFGLQDCLNVDSDALLSQYSRRDSAGNIVDTDDISEFFVGHRLVSYNGEDREVFILAVRGTNGTHEEWTSNFDIGADAPEYYEITGEHPDWLNKVNHKGFDVTANRIITAFDTYVAGLEAEGKLNTGAKRSIFITGHSRGAAIANLLGAAFEDREGYDSYTYTMAAPYSTTSENTAGYKTIFNIMNVDDLVTYLPLDSWGFGKYGQTLTMSILDNFEDENTFGDEEYVFENLIGMDYNSNSYVNSAVEAFGKMSNGRSDFYILDTTSGDGRVMEGTVNFGDTFDNLIKLLKTGKMYRFCEVEKADLWVGYNIYVTNSPAYVGQNVANLASCGDIEKRYGYNVMEWIGIDLKGRYSDARYQFALASGQISVGGVGPGGMEHPHIPASYYLICGGTPYEAYGK